MVTATIILLVFSLLGNQIIAFFHVSVAALEIAGGAILFVFALQIVLGEEATTTAPPGARASPSTRWRCR